jgi:hypothetical protein
MVVRLSVLVVDGSAPARRQFDGTIPNHAVPKASQIAAVGIEAGKTLKVVEQQLLP